MAFCSLDNHFYIRKLCRQEKIKGIFWNLKIIKTIFVTEVSILDENLLKHFFYLFYSSQKLKRK